MKSRSTGWVSLLTLLVLLAWSQGIGVAQVTYGTFRGLVTDPSGAGIPGASITATEKTRGFTKIVVSGPDGIYEIPSLLEGTYTLTAELFGVASAASAVWV